jgi:hypothetical protein
MMFALTMAVAIAAGFFARESFAGVAGAILLALAFYAVIHAVA